VRNRIISLLSEPMATLPKIQYAIDLQRYATAGGHGIIPGWYIGQGCNSPAFSALSRHHFGIKAHD